MDAARARNIRLALLLALIPLGLFILTLLGFVR